MKCRATLRFRANTAYQYSMMASYITKQVNNGTCFAASPIELSHLAKTAIKTIVTGNDVEPHDSQGGLK